MPVMLRKRVLSRAGVAALDDLERRQLIAAGKECLGERGETLDAVLAWCDREQLGWMILDLALPGGERFDLWLLGSEDGVAFEAGSATPSGLGVSQDQVSDSAGSRDALAAAIQEELTAFDRPPHEDWSRK